jgi:antitoxin MazE
MKVSLISIGNSKGVRIPASVIRECGLGAELELRVKNGSVVLSPARAVRGGWSDAFRRMAAEGDDAPLLPEDVGTQFDAEDWTW